MLAPDCEIEVVRNLERPVLRPAVDARAPRVERVEHRDGHGLRDGAHLARGVVELHVKLDERRTSDQALHLAAQLPVGAVAIGRALRQVEAPDPTVERFVLPEFVLDAERLVLGQAVLDADGAVGRAGGI